MGRLLSFCKSEQFCTDAIDGWAHIFDGRPIEDRQMWFYVQMWLPVWTVALTAAICFSVASFIMERSVKPHQL